MYQKDRILKKIDYFENRREWLGIPLKPVLIEWYSEDKPWKYEKLADLIMTIRDEDICNDCYDRVRVHPALKLKAPADTTIPSERTVYRVMKELGIVQPKDENQTGSRKRKEMLGNLMIC